jgi:hypothetical protein
MFLEYIRILFKYITIKPFKSLVKVVLIYTWNIASVFARLKGIIKYLK